MLMLNSHTSRLCTVINTGICQLNTKFLLLSLLLSFLPLMASNSHSPYAGEEQRRIKSLSTQDIDDLQQGRGWGLAKAAELNGLPGPVHLLEMQTEIGLTEQQKQQIEALYASMKEKAIPLGQQLVALELELDTAFAKDDIDAARLETLLIEIARVGGQLRFVHLSSHLKTPAILTPHQVATYNQLRGYQTKIPCAEVPAGHDPKMWRQHMGCK